MNLIGYRKLIAAAVAMGISTLLLCFHFLQGSDWSMFNASQLAFFFGTNCVAKIWGRDSEPS